MKLYGGLIGVVLIAAILLIVSAANRPNYDLEFRRDVRSTEPLDTVTRALEHTATWPRWFHSLKAVEGPARIQPGDEVLLKIEPPKKSWKRFEIRVKVLEITPITRAGRRLRLAMINDSTGKLNSAFERLEWEVSIENPSDQEHTIVGICRTRTQTWRTRVFGTFARKILMHQIYYPNLIALSRITQPEAQFLETSP
jgi:hypothetical protein